KAYLLGSKKWCLNRVKPEETLAEARHANQLSNLDMVSSSLFLIPQKGVSSSRQQNGGYKSWNSLRSCNNSPAK
ncbi:10688_t:CDS:2, partial [Gigaspora margarita]